MIEIQKTTDYLEHYVFPSNLMSLLITIVCSFYLISCKKESDVQKISVKEINQSVAIISSTLL